MKNKRSILEKRKRTYPKWGCCNGFDVDFIYQRWLEVVASFKFNSLKEITNKEVGATINRARKDRNMNLAQVAGILKTKTVSEESISKVREIIDRCVFIFINDF